MQTNREVNSESLGTSEDRKVFQKAMACETLILRKYFARHGKIRLIYSVAGHAYGPAHEARLVQLTVGAAKEQTAREYR